MYKVLKQTKFPVLASKKIYKEIEQDRVIYCQHPSFQEEFDKLVAEGVLELVLEPKKPIEKPIEKPKETVK
jgi:hypothetical protein